MDKAAMARWNKAYKESEIAKLDQEGRHRSEWCYSKYDGRQDGEIPHGAGYQIDTIDQTMDKLKAINKAFRDRVNKKTSDED